MFWRWVGLSPAMKDRTSLGLTSAASPEKSHLPRDGSVLLEYSSSHLLLKLTAEKSQWQLLVLSLAAASNRRDVAGLGRMKGQQKKKQKYLGQKGSKRIPHY